MAERVVHRRSMAAQRRTDSCRYRPDGCTRRRATRPRARRPPLERALVVSRVLLRARCRAPGAAPVHGPRGSSDRRPSRIGPSWVQRCAPSLACAPGSRIGVGPRIALRSTARRQGPRRGGASARQRPRASGRAPTAHRASEPLAAPKALAAGPRMLGALERSHALRARRRFPRGRSHRSRSRSGARSHEPGPVRGRGRSRPSVGAG